MIVTGHIPSCASGKSGRPKSAVHPTAPRRVRLHPPSRPVEQRLAGRMADLGGADRDLGSAVQAMAEVATGLTIDTDALQANMDATEGAVLAERATFLLAEKMGKQKAGKLVEAALAKGGSFVEALGQLEAELADEAALLGYSPKFVDRLLADLRRQ